MVAACAVLGCVFLILMAAEDWKTMEISGWKCTATWALTIVSWYLCGHNIVAGVVILILLIVYYAPFELSVFGDADIIPLAMFIAIPCSLGLFSIYVLSYPITLLLCLVPYGKLYAREHGFSWKFGDKVIMPALPCFAVSWCVSTLSNIVCVILLEGVRGLI